MKTNLSSLQGEAKWKISPLADKKPGQNSLSQILGKPSVLGPPVHACCSKDMVPLILSGQWRRSLGELSKRGLLRSGSLSLGFLSAPPLTCSQVPSPLQRTFGVLAKLSQFGVPSIAAWLWTLEKLLSSFLHCVMRTETVSTPQFVNKRIHQEWGSECLAHSKFPINSVYYYLNNPPLLCLLLDKMIEKT